MNHHLKNVWILLGIVAGSLAVKANNQSEWNYLLNGDSGPAFRAFKSDALPPNWNLVDGILKASGGNVDIVSLEQYGDFELELEYCLEKGGNSGIFFFVKEHAIFDKVWRTGIEFQVIDNENSPLAQKSPKNRAGSVYALYGPSVDSTLPAGSWNKVRILVKQGRVEYWINGVQVLAFHVGSDAWYVDREQTLHNSGRKPFWGEFRRGHIALQDEGFPVAYRNIRIRTLAP